MLSQLPISLSSLGSRHRAPPRTARVLEQIKQGLTRRRTPADAFYPLDKSLYVRLIQPHAVTLLVLRNSAQLRRELDRVGTKIVKVR
jgi:hypothetical protein